MPVAALASPRPSHARRSAAHPPPAASLLDEAEAGPEDRVLIVGAASVDLLCDAMRHGCRGAIEAVTPSMHPEPADVVVAPRVATEAEAVAVLTCASRALGQRPQGGRLAVLLPGAPARGIARVITARLHALGFTRIRLRALAEGGLMLVCRRAPTPAAS
ncbi:hypothetical protein [Plastoroseomonas arctica]|uniref:Uncharacterized protein n=1 Tax=Plastoroseomonas arctica TaxID=1509237 RepID=A0AAF1JW51_9PROT|nr:hypothetical protein [Plastoroseomonas arctica]MBR0653454.1 hypothetical protein [Plastoroseomonas arctica]